ncbi:hypothetical protein FRX31_013484 [Thalictrum thalictroides]|uniref:Uncharacterized protein n=1 Tax=Thalictrum thalictroides TaxID=46969 RepID=A0A7J6WK10_THATH|nr:hypothetical protein FRX31_013484 [Thalictrum thalictroides]
MDLAIWKRNRCLLEKVIDAKYGIGDSNGVPKPIDSPYGWSLWRGILSSLPKFKEGLSFKIVDGRCSVTESIWRRLTGHVQNLDVVIHQDNVRVLLDRWPNLNGTRLGQAVWQVLPVAVMWCIWKGRNNKIFKGRDFIVDSIISCVKYTVWAWLEMTKEGGQMKRDCRITQLLLNWEGTVTGDCS